MSELMWRDPSTDPPPSPPPPSEEQAVPVSTATTTEQQAQIALLQEKLNKAAIFLKRYTLEAATHAKENEALKLERDALQAALNQATLTTTTSPPPPVTSTLKVSTITTERHDVLQEELGNLKQAHAQQLVLQENLEREIQQLQSTLYQQADTHQEDRNLLQQQLNGKSSDVDSLTLAHQELMNELDLIKDRAVKAELALEQGQIQHQQLLQQIDTLTTRNVQLESSIKEVSQENEGLQSAILGLKSQVEELRTPKPLAESSTTDLSSLDSSPSTQRQSPDAHNPEIKKLQDYIVQLKTAMKTKWQVLQDDAKKAKESLTKEQQNVVAKESLCLELQNRIEELINEKEIAISTVQSDLSTRIAQLETQLETFLNAPPPPAPASPPSPPPFFPKDIIYRILQSILTDSHLPEDTPSELLPLVQEVLEHISFQLQTAKTDAQKSMDKMLAQRDSVASQAMVTSVDSATTTQDADYQAELKALEENYKSQLAQINEVWEERVRQATEAVTSSTETKESITQIEGELARAVAEKDALADKFVKFKSAIAVRLQEEVDNGMQVKEELAEAHAEIERLQIDLHDLQLQCNADRAAAASSISQDIMNERVAALEQRYQQEISRLQQHLLELEETHTQEMMKLELALQECQAQLSQSEHDRAGWDDRLQYEKETAAASVAKLESIQLQLHEAREEIRALRESAKTADVAMANLSEVLEQVQISRDAQIRHATQVLNGELEVKDKEIAELKGQMKELQTKSSHSAEHEIALTKLKEELADKTSIIGHLRLDTMRLQNHLSEAMKMMKPKGASGADGVDPKLMSNLLVGFITTPRGDKKRYEILNVIANVCTFTEDDKWRVGLTKKPGWSPQSLPPPPSESFTDAFIAFLMKETGDIPPPPTPAMKSNPISPSYLDPAPRPDSVAGSTRRSSLMVSPMDNTLLVFGEPPSSPSPAPPE